MFEYVFVFYHATMNISLVTYRENFRTHEHSNWHLRSLWRFTLDAPLHPHGVPAWAEADIKAQIANSITLDR